MGGRGCLNPADRHGQGCDAGLQAQAKVKLAEIETRIADLHTIRKNLRTALDAGCEDLTVCAGAAASLTPGPDRS